MPPLRIAALSFLLIFAIAVTAGSAAAQSLGAEHHAPELRAKKTCTLKKKAKCKKTTVTKQKIGKQNLSGSNLSGAVITGSTFTGTNLRNVDLSNATLTNVTFKNVDLGGVTMTGATLVNVRFDHVDASTGSSGRACEIISGSENDGCVLPGFRADNSNIRDVYLSNSIFDRSTWRNVTFDNAGFVNCSLNDADFTGADFGRGPHGGVSARIGAEALRTRFDNSKRLTLFRVIADESSFLGATDFTHVDSSLKDARGLQGSRTVTVSNAPGFTFLPKLIQIKETGYWRPGNLCLTARTCSYTAAVGSPLQIIVRSVIPFSVSGAGLTCTQALLAGLPATTCVGDSLPAGSDPLAVTFGPYDPSPPAVPAAPPVVTHTVTANVLVGLGSFDLITISTVYDDGVVTEVKRCTNVAGGATCVATVVDGASVRLSVSHEGTDPYFFVQCLGESSQNPDVKSHSYSCPDVPITTDMRASFMVS